MRSGVKTPQENCTQQRRFEGRRTGKSLIKNNAFSRHSDELQHFIFEKTEVLLSEHMRIRFFGIQLSFLSVRSASAKQKHPVYGGFQVPQLRGHDDRENH